jgi:tetratricopeptide (TPR) repeat protein
LKKFGAARFYCECAIEIEPKNIFALCSMVWFLEHSKKYEESLKWYNKAIELDPDNQIAIYHKNKAQDELEKMKKDSFLKKLSKL